jgi:small-conductance mechanosensitive channel
LSISTASEWLIRSLFGLIDHLRALQPTEVAINVGLSLAVAVAAVGLDYGLKRLVRRGVADLPSTPVAETVKGSQAVKLGLASLKVALIVGAVWLILAVWGLDPTAWIQGAAGERLLRLAGRLLVLTLIAVGLFELTGFTIDRAMGRLAAGAREPRRAAQLRTLAPLLKGITRGTVVVLAAMMLLSEIGVKIGPLLAGAGVVGVALGFGAQTLVKDFLTGLFFIIEDIVSVGDTVRIGDSKGQVESMTMRTIRLRDFDGTLHVFPYSEAQVVHNETKAFSYAVVDLHIANDADVEAALKAMEEVGRELAADPRFASKILGPVEVVGVEGVTEAGQRIRARIKTLPREDPVAQREFYRRLKAAFDKRGIALPTASMRLVLPDGSPAAPGFASQH